LETIEAQRPARMARALIVLRSIIKGIKLVKNYRLSTSTIANLQPIFKLPGQVGMVHFYAIFILLVGAKHPPHRSRMNEYLAGGYFALS
jgi:hypothetical protein